ncbi:Transglutaminase-like enzyme, putative cysteine protease [Quadrisphaera granulorum]|uniref:Transglutaminase-like putative cysteine protease n=1 Tax=Quadrisphaera granulorum TaxID=317664 RepID=A0A316A850_9ACTN|nr:transglutaminase family protein [Quadrisphaera granulorum]PWJ54021.1 transglutaminase-like putative cysteine protease [Quadrisphaera granulorum]SZE96478.1 Transglutaminase-like enzyme, putative cysteine protease [Quadrisphaera granulorum]
MSSRLRIAHHTGYRYGAPVTSSYNEVRVAPMTTPEQTALRTRLEVRPAPWQHVYHDYWGSQVTVFEVHEPHSELAVTATSTVEVDRPSTPPPGGGWDVLRDPRTSDELIELLTCSPATAPPPELVERVTALVDAGASPDDLAAEVCSQLHREIRYVPGATGVHSHAADAWGERAGVCQDFAHLALGALRTAGIPARYVSGYLHPDPTAPIGATVTGESHAWVEWWTGEWFSWDPTNDVAPGDRHVIVARGREYSDVPPLKGVYAGGAPSEMVVKVDITRLA